MTIRDEFDVGRERARPLAPDERREAILDAALPLLREKGRDVTSREIAEAAGVAEGTIFRAFGDKDSLIVAAIDRLFDLEPFRVELRAIPHDLPLEDKLARIIDRLRQRFHEVFRLMTVFQLAGPPSHPDREEWISIVHELLEPDLPRLGIGVETLAYYLRLVAFGSSIDPFNALRPFDPAELAELIVHGVATS